MSLLRSWFCLTFFWDGVFLFFFTGRVIYFKKGHSFVTNNGDEILIMCTNPKQGDDKFWYLSETPPPDCNSSIIIDPRKQVCKPSSSQYYYVRTTTLQHGVGFFPVFSSFCKLLLLRRPFWPCRQAAQLGGSSLGPGVVGIFDRQADNG